MNGISQSLLCICCIEEGIEDLSPKVSEPRETASSYHCEDYSQSQKDIVIPLGEPIEFKEGYFVFFLQTGF